MVRLSAVTLCLALSALVANGQSLDSRPDAGWFTPDLIRYAITQGGLAMVLLAVFWSYRRDFLRTDAQQTETNQALLEIARSSTKAIVESTATTARLARAMERAKLIRADEGAS